MRALRFDDDDQGIAVLHGLTPEVMREHRRQPLAAALLKAALSAASGWGFEAIVAETSPADRQTYPLLQRMGLDPIGSFVPLERPAPIAGG